MSSTPIAKYTLTGHKGPVYCLLALPQPGSFLSGSGDGTVVHWQVDHPDAGELLVNVAQAVFCLCLLPDHGLLLIGTEGGGLHVVDLHARAELHHFAVHRRGLFALHALPDRRVVAAGGDGTLSIWQVREDRPGLDLIRHFPLCEEKLRGLATSPDGHWTAVACGDGTVRILDNTLFNEHHTIYAHRGTAEGSTGAGCVAFHPGKPALLSGGKDGHLRTWHIGEGYRPLQAIPAHKGGIYALAMDPAGVRLATASRDKTAKIWDATTLEPLARLDRAAGGHSHSVNAALWLGDTLITGSDDRSIKVWNTSA